MYISFWAPFLNFSHCPEIASGMPHPCKTDTLYVGPISPCLKVENYLREKGRGECGAHILCFLLKAYSTYIAGSPELLFCTFYPVLMTVPVIESHTWDTAMAGMSSPLLFNSLSCNFHSAPPVKLPAGITRGFHGVSPMGTLSPYSTLSLSNVWHSWLIPVCGFLAIHSWNSCYLCDHFFLVLYVDLIFLIQRFHVGAPHTLR